MKHYELPNIPNFMDFAPGRRVLALGLVALLGQAAWVPSPISISLDWSPPPLQEVREAPLASLDAGSLPAPAPVPRSIFRIPITVTGYSSTVDQTDDTPTITAMNTPVRPGIIALSRDLLRQFTPGAPFSFGDIVELEGVGIFTVEDTMSPRFTKRADIWFSSRASARNWGRRNLNLAALTPLAQAGSYLAQAENPVFEPAHFD